MVCASAVSHAVILCASAVSHVVIMCASAMSHSVRMCASAMCHSRFSSNTPFGCKEFVYNPDGGQMLFLVISYRDSSYSDRFKG